MQSSAKSVKEYLLELPSDRLAAMSKLRSAIKNNIPKGFKECMNYGMIGYVVPHSLYPDGYHVSPESPLPFMAIASQKNFIALYHMGISSDPKLLKWFQDEYKKQMSTKLDMGKSCIRLKNINQVPFDLIGKLASKMTPAQWIAIYEGYKSR